jgi:flagellar assembly protein FliH
VRGITVTRAVERYRYAEERAAAAESSAADEAASLDGLLAAARDEAYGRGVSEGTARGREEAEAHLHEAVKTLGRVAARLSAEREAVIAGAERDLLALALAIAARVVRREVSLDRALVERILAEALRRVSPLEEIVVRVHPTDYAALHEAPGTLAALAEIRHFELAEDRRVGQGGCLIESAAGAIDARLATALEEIERALARAADEEPGGAAAV